MAKPQAPPKFTKMYLVPMDIYNQVKEHITNDEEIEMTEINKDLENNDFFSDTIKNEKKPQEPIKKSTVQNITAANQPTTPTSTIPKSAPFTPNTTFNNSDVNSAFSVPSSNTPTTIKRKMRTPKPEYTCEDCGKVYKRKSYFIKHLCPNVTRTSLADQSDISFAGNETFARNENKEDVHNQHQRNIQRSSRNAANVNYERFFK